MEEKYKVTFPETMQEAPISDSEEEGGIIKIVSFKLIYAALFFCARFYFSCELK